MTTTAPSTSSGRTRPSAALAPGATTTSRAVLHGVLALAGLSVGGAFISLSSGLSPTFLEAMGPVGRLSIPLPMVACQVVMALAAGSRRRGLAMTGSGLVALGLLAGVVSGFYDGGYGDPRLTGFERGYQVVLIGGLVAVGGIAAARFVRVARG